MTQSLKQKKKAPQKPTVAESVERLYGLIWSLDPASSHQGGKAPSSQEKRAFYTTNLMQ